MTFTDRGQGYDVAIGGLPFKLAISGEQPYERATAQFRKEQFDSAPTVGDQSLTGWWTRGQLSFHKGAGVTYYEVLDGETVLDRFNDSDLVEVSTPGKVTLFPSLADMSIGALDAVPAPLSAGGGVYVLTDAGVKYTAGTGAPTSIATSDAGIPTSITSNGRIYYATNATKIEQQFDSTAVRTNHVANPSFETNTTSWSGSGTSLSQTNYVTNPSIETNTTGYASSNTVRTNLIPNPSAAVNTTGWTVTGGAGTLTQAAFTDTTDGTSGYFRLDATAAVGNLGMQSDFITVSPSVDYTVSAYVRSRVANTESGVGIVFAANWYDAANVLISFSQVDVGLDFPHTTNWDRREATLTAPALTAKCKVEVRYYSFSNIDSGDRHWFDHVMLEQSSEMSDYFDGDTTDVSGATYAWTGSASASSSTATYTSTLSSSATQFKYGTKSLKVVGTASAVNPAKATYTVSGLTNGVTYKTSVWVYVEAQERSVAWKAGSTTLDTNATEGGWEELTGAFVASGTSQAFSFEHAGSGDAAAFYVDGFLVTTDPWTEGYFDGDTADGSVTYSWTGTANGSTSTAVDSSTTILTASTTHAKFGTKSLKVTDEHGRVTPLTVTYTVTGLTIATNYVISGWVWLDGTGTRTVDMKTGSTVLDTSTIEDGWEELTGTFTATGTSHTLVFTHSGSGDAANFYVDACLWTEAPFSAGYFDGSQPGAAWNGTAHASKSTFAGGSATASTALITLSGGNQWVGAWWAKGRVFAVDDQGFWYALPAAVDTVTTADAFWSSGQATASWSLTEGTGPVYISNGFDIYSVTVSTDGVVPVVTTPTTAARMPLGEQISTIGYYLGYIVIATSRGVRVALTQDDQVLLGPLVLKGDFSSSNRIGLFDTRAYVAGRLDGRGGVVVVCAIDLGQFVTDLIPAWEPLSTVSDLASTADGAMVDSTGKLYTWASEVLLAASRDELSTDGYITTGFHRFGTLEPKHFQSVLVRLGGTTGAVAVTRVDSDGTETDLETITLPATNETVDLDLTTPQEMVGLKFTLTRSALDPTMGPELLGYQLRAMPAPKRQRMIRLPLMLKDVEQRGGAPSKGYKGSAWERLEALEAMEQNGGTFAFVDYRTGEEGTVFVESVEHKGLTAPGNGATGFGGTLFVTLRKIEV